MGNEWVHCNYCGQLPESNTRFYLSNCGHVGCVKCANPGCSRQRCCLCNQEVKMVEINSKMDSELKLYFSDPVKTQKSFMDEMKQIEEFQQKNRTRLLAHKNEVLDKVGGLARNCKKEVAENSKTIANMSMHIANLEKEKLELSTQLKTIRGALMHEGTFINDG